MLIKATLQTELEREKRGDERSKKDKKMISVMVLAGKS